MITKSEKSVQLFSNRCQVFVPNEAILGNEFHNAPLGPSLSSYFNDNAMLTMLKFTLAIV